MLQFVWKKEKTTLEHQVGRYEIVLNEVENTYTTTLTILTTELTDSGKYTLFVRNDYGEVKATVSLMVKGQSDQFQFRFPFWFLFAVSVPLALSACLCLHFIEEATSWILVFHAVKLFIHILRAKDIV